MSSSEKIVRVGIYGAGNFANQTHIPNLLKLPGVEIVAVCDVDPSALASTSTTFQIPRAYRDGHEMLEKEEMDALYSIVPAFARSDVEATAAARGIHLFSEKPQALRMAVARKIGHAIQASGVISTVGFRERYRPLFQEARRLLHDKRVVHVLFQNTGPLPPSKLPAGGRNWWLDVEKGGYSGFDWGAHAVDYSRFVTGLDLVRAQAFYHQTDEYLLPLSCSSHFLLSNGATMNMTFLSATPVSPKPHQRFVIFYEGGYLAMDRYHRLEVNGETVYEMGEFDPWLEQDRAFIEAVRSGQRGSLLNDYHDGLFSLAPVLAAWESSRRGGDCIDVGRFMEEEGS